MLADSLFPTSEVREFYRDDLAGSLDVITNYDYIQINATASNDQFLTLLESLSAAITNPTIDKESTAPMKALELGKIASSMKDAAYVADTAAASRLFGTFPYGRPRLGTAESVQKIDFADLIDLKQRFLTADNATVAISGNIDGNLAYRAATRYLGGWLKSDKRVPSTFRQPDAPKAGMPIFDSPVPNTSEFRFAVRGTARGEKDYYASAVLARILDRRLKQAEGGKAFVRYEANVLPGSLLFGISDWYLGKIKRDGDKIDLPMTDGYVKKIFEVAVKPEEFDTAKRELAISLAQAPGSDLWLDTETYKLVSAAADAEAAQAVSLADAQRVLERLQKEPVAQVLVFSEAAAATAN